MHRLCMESTIILSCRIVGTICTLIQSDNARLRRGLSKLITDMKYIYFFKLHQLEFRFKIAYRK
jgi:hypothetical protein